jgi:predicted flap endonuclease-1-like 5' DNA nuclease
VIWHFFEVWLSLLAAFLIGCTMGALAYDLLARSRLAAVQGAIADSIGDAVDGIKDRLGVGPVWRPQYGRIVEVRQAEGAVENVPGDGDRRIGAGESASAPAWEDDGADREVADVDADGGWLDEAEPIDARDEDAGAGDWEAPATASDGIVPMRPASLAEPRNGVPDNLQRIRGIGERNEMRLNKLGIFHFGQIAAWTPAEMRWVAQQLAFPERIERDDWVGQAIILASGGDTGFTKSAERRRARRQEELDQARRDEDEADNRS